MEQTVIKTVVFLSFVFRVQLTSSFSPGEKHYVFKGMRMTLFIGQRNRNVDVKFIKFPFLYSSTLFIYFNFSLDNSKIFFREKKIGSILLQQQKNSVGNELKSIKTSRFPFINSMYSN